MAKARDIPDLHADEPFADAAAKVVAVRAEELADHSENVLDTRDIERVHDMRVATRRLRAVLEIFAPCFPKDLHREVVRDVKALADALGERRDPDVQISALDEFAGGAKASSRTGVRLLVGRFSDEQSEANARLAKALDRAKETDLEGRLQALIGSARAGRLTRPPKSQARTASGGQA
jgi:CHAD domain-containing protein